MVEKVSRLRPQRNLFIHGLWDNPYLKDANVFISCLEPKIVSSVGSYGRWWASAKEHKFELSYLIQEIKELNSAIEIQEKILNKLEGHTF